MRKMLVLVALLFLFTACGGDDDDATNTTTQATTPAATETTAPAAAGDRQAALIDAIDVDAMTLSYDPIEFLTGDEAIARYRADNPSDAEGFPENDYVIVNDDETLTTTPIAEDVTVGLTHHLGTDLHPGTVEELPDYEGVTDVPFWLTIDTGEIVKIEEQFVP